MLQKINVFKKRRLKKGKENKQRGNENSTSPTRGKLI
jgi:hypothetical protein